MASTQGYYREEEAFWQKRQAKLRQMSGLQTTDQDSLKHEDQENVYVASSGDALQLGWKRGEEGWAERLPLISLQTNRGTGNRAALELHKQILAMAEIREDVEQHLRRIEGRRQLLTEQKVAEQRRLIRMLDAQLKEACDGCHAQEHELRDLLAEVLGQLHAFTGILEGSKSMPDEATLLDLPARVDYLQRKKTLLLACTQPSSTLHMSLAAQPSALATESPMGLLPGRQEPDVAIRTLRQAVGLPTDEDNFKVAESLLKQSPDSKTSNPTRQLKRAYAAMLQAVKEQHLAEKEHLIQACRKELCQQKAAYDRALAEVLERQQCQKAQAAKETAAEALRSHPLADTPPRGPHAMAHASPLQDGPVPRTPVLRSSPLGERQRPCSASLQRLSSAHRKPLAAGSTVPAAQEAQSPQQPPACQHVAAALEGAGHHAHAREQNLSAPLTAHGQRSEVSSQPAASRRRAAQAPAAERHHAPCSPSALPSSEAIPTKAHAPAASSALRVAAMKSPFQAVQPPVGSTGTSTFSRQATGATVLQGSRRPAVEEMAEHAFSKAQSAGLKEDVIQPSGPPNLRRALTRGHSSTAAGSVRERTGAEPTQSGLASPVSLDGSPLVKGGSQGMAELKELGSASGPGSPTYRALAQHAASIETFLAAGDASRSAQDESTALAQLMQVLNECPAPDDL